MIRKLLKTEFHKIYKLMEISFPKDEYRNYDKQLSLMDNPAYRIYVMPDMETDDIKAFIAVWEFETIVYIEHFAVNPDHRNNGLGSKILCEIIEIVNKTICLEVELPENELAVRRIGFYERNDFCLNDYPYMQPAISDGGKPVPLMIMTHGKHVDHYNFHKIKTLLYTHVYKQV